MSGFFAKLTSVFAAEPEAATHDPGAVALAALMVQLARADGVYDEDERAGIAAALDARFGDGAGILAEGEAAEAGALDSHQFTRLLKDEFAHEDRAALLEDLWSVVLADGARDAHEDALMRRIGALLHVSDREIGLARQRVLARQG